MNMSSTAQAQRELFITQKNVETKYAGTIKGEAFIIKGKTELVAGLCEIREHESDDKLVAGVGEVTDEFTRINTMKFKWQTPIDIELDQLGESHNHAAIEQLINDDYKEVWQEIRHIQECRSHLFIATIGSAVATFGTFSTIGLTSTSNTSTLLLIGSLITLLLLLIGLLSVVEKAKAINFRKGFLMTLAEIRRQGVYPENYRGWPDLQSAYNDCTAFQRSGRCMMSIQNASADSNNKLDRVFAHHCWKMGENIYTERRRSIKLFPSLTESFMSFSSHVYMSMLTVALTVFLICIWQLTRSVWEDHGTLLSIMTFVCAAFAGAVIPYRGYKRARRVDIMHTRASHLDKYFKYIAGVVSLVLLVGVSIELAKMHVKSVTFSSVSWVIYSLHYAMLPLAVFIASYILFRSLSYLEDCRIGTHSRVVHHNAWRHVLRFCHPREAARQVSQSQRECAERSKIKTAEIFTSKL